MFRNSFRAPVFVLALVGLLALACASPAHAQTATRVTPCDAATPTNAVCVSWSAITTDTTGAPLTKAVTYRVEQRQGTAGFLTAATGTDTRYYAKGLAAGTWTFRVFANCTPNCAESAASNALSKDAADPVTTPATPIIVIAALIRAGQPPVYRIIQRATLAPNEIAFVAPASMRTAFGL